MELSADTDAAWMLAACHLCLLYAEVANFSIPRTQNVAHTDKLLCFTVKNLTCFCIGILTTEEHGYRLRLTAKTWH